MTKKQLCYEVHKVLKILEAPFSKTVLEKRKGNSPDTTN